MAFPRRAYSGMIFDCDGTLTDSMPVHFVAWARTMRRYKIDFPEERFYALGGVPSNKIIELLSTEQQIEIDVAKASREKEDAFLELLHLLEPIPAVMAVASHFRGKIPIAVASGGCRDIISKQLVQIGCQDWFQAIVTAEDTPRHKPFPDVFLLAAEQMKVNPLECIVYEDSDLGIEAAKAAHMDWIDVRHFHTPKKIDTSR